tara:strand:- start:208 stop:792 length:585 start_codon:yes stop_codon:yes gene_type:complete
MIAIGGLARSGKDTLAQGLADIIKEDFRCEVKIYSFASPIRCQLKNLLEEYYHISPFTEDDDEKLIIRPVMVAHGEQMKKKFGKDIWLKELMNTIEEDRSKNEKVFPIISDIRFDSEVEAVQGSGGMVVHIKKLGNKPPNDIEKLNDPLVRNAANLKHTWPEYEPDDMIECNDHAQILWQMLKESNQVWKKIYS